MSANKRNPKMIVDFTDESALVTDLKQAIVSLQNSPNTQFRLHVCLNGIDGYAALHRLVTNPATKIRAYLLPHLVLGGRDLWLNTKLMVFVGDSGSSNMAILSPQQTGCIVRSLPGGSKNLFLEKVKEWYHESFLEEIKNGLDAITNQVENGNLLVEDDHGNRVFDIHGGRYLDDIPYTEAEVVGEYLFWAIVHGATCMEYGSDGYDRADAFICGRRERQKTAAKEFLGIAREFHELGS